MLLLRDDGTLRGGLHRENQGKEEGGDGSKGDAKGKRKATKDAGKEGSGKSGGPNLGRIERLGLPRTVDVRSQGEPTQQIW